MDISWLTPVYEATGPFATVHLDVSRNDESGAHEVELRWRAARETLAEAGAPEQLLEQLEPVATATPEIGGRAGRTVVATADGGILLDRALPGGVQERAVWGPLPDLVPLVRRIGGRPPYLVVLVDREGADIEVWGPGEVEPRETETVKGKTYPLTKVGSGGWSHLRYQHRAENLWKHNADDVAEDVNRLVATTGSRLLAVAGDQQMVTILQDKLSDRAQQAFVYLEHGSRAEGSSREALEEELDVQLAKVEALELTEVLDAYHEQRGRGHAAVEGIDATCEALRKAQVRTLLLSDELNADATLFSGVQPSVLALTEAEVRTLGEEEPVEADAAGVLVRAAVGTDAGLVVVPAGAESLKDGVAALLRYTDASTG